MTHQICQPADEDKLRHCYTGENIDEMKFKGPEKSIIIIMLIRALMKWSSEKLEKRRLDESTDEIGLLKN